jgi:hypothetical protein
MSLKTRINKIEEDLNMKLVIQQPQILYFAGAYNPTEEEKEIVMKRAVELNSYEASTICYLPWESRRLAPFPRPIKGESLEGFEWKWDYELGIGFGNNMIFKFVGEFPKGKEFENDSEIFKVSNVDENGNAL